MGTNSMGKNMIWTLPVVAVVLLLLQYFWPLRKFSRSTASKNILFHALFSILIIAEVRVLSQWPALPQSSLLNFHTEYRAIDFLLCFLGLDLLSYFWHRINHMLPFLWRFHEFHHKATSLDPLAAYRFHPVEVFLGFQLRALVVWFLGFSSQEVAVFIVLYGSFNLFQHSNLRLPKSLDEILSWVFVTPTRHHVHHLRGREFQNSNYATVFIFWDKLFKSYKNPQRIQPNDIGLNREKK